MNSIQDKYQKIMEVMSDKTLSFGCELDVGFPDVYYVRVIARLNSNKYTICNHHRNTKYEGMQDIVEYKDNFSVERTPIPEITKIIGHPLMISYVLSYFEVNKWGFYGEKQKDLAELLILLSKWKDKRLPLSPTDEELVDYIYNLLP